MEKRSKPRAESKDISRAQAFFGILTVAAEDGEFGTAAAAQQKLAELGWRVDRKASAGTAEKAATQ